MPSRLVTTIDSGCGIDDVREEIVVRVADATFIGAVRVADEDLERMRRVGDEQGQRSVVSTRLKFRTSRCAVNQRI